MLLHALQKDNLRVNYTYNQLNDLLTNALSSTQFELYDSGTNAFQGIVGVDISRSVRGNMRSARALKWGVMRRVHRA